MSRDTSPNYFLIQLPCDCIANTMEMPYSNRTKRVPVIIECPWCKTHFRSDELSEWVGGSEQPISARLSPRLIKVKDKNLALEVVDQCNGCGAPIVRVGGCKPFHLSVPKEDIERLVD